MRQIIVGFSAPKKANILSNIIMKVMGRPFSHVYLSFRSESLKRNIIYQGNRKGLHFLNKEKFLRKNKIIAYFCIDLENEKYLNAMRSCVDHAGEQYGYMQLIGLGISKILKKIGIDWTNTFFNGYICSEIVAQVLLDSGFVSKKELKKNINHITPEDIYLLIQSKDFI